MKPSAASRIQSRRSSRVFPGRRDTHQAIATKNGAEYSMRSVSSVSASTACHA